MKIRLRLNGPVTDQRHQSFILGTAFRETANQLMLYCPNSDGYFPKNPFTFSDDGTSLEATFSETVTEGNVQKFKHTAMHMINKELLGNTTKFYEPPSDLPDILVKVMEVENDQVKAR
jgi:hypothetical protein